MTLILTGSPTRYGEDHITTDNGLLAAAERLQGETVVYTMRALTAEIGTVDAEAFTLPDGEILYDPNTEESEG